MASPPVHSFGSETDMMKILIAVGLLLLLSTTPAAAKYDCLDYALASGEPVILIGKHPFFYGSMDSEVNHFLNYEIIDNETMRFTDHNVNSSMNVSTTSWEEIRPEVYFDGFNYFKLFIYREPQRYWRKML